MSTAIWSSLRESLTVYSYKTKQFYQQLLCSVQRESIFIRRLHDSLNLYNDLFLAVEDVTLGVLRLLQLLSLEVGVVESLGQLHSAHVELRLRRDHVRLVDAAQRTTVDVVWA